MVRTKIGPGPGKYLLPPLVGHKDHDTTKYRYPMYSMGERVGISKKNLGPGPKYNTEFMTSYGKASPPAYSIVSRMNELKSFQGPGPAAYGLQNAPRIKTPNPPAYSVSDRHNLKRTWDTPAPNNYELPTTIGPKVPDKHANGAFSLSNRNQISGKEASPGPAKYDPTSPSLYKNKPPEYSMRTKTKEIGMKGPTPGPNNYYPKLAQKGGYSFGLKTDNSPYITADDEMPCINK